MIKDNNVRKQITFNKDFLELVEKQAEKDDRTLSNLITVALKEYLKNHGGGRTGEDEGV